MRLLRRCLSTLAFSIALVLTGTLPSWAVAGWNSLSPLLPPGDRWGTAAANDDTNSNVVMFGGCVRDNAVCNTSTVLDETYTWSGSAWLLKTPLSKPSARVGAAMAYDDLNDKVVLFGGISGSGTLLDDTWTWNGSNWTQQNPAHKPSARVWAAAATDSSTEVMLFGGCEAVNSQWKCTQFDNETWRWTGSDWEKPCTNAVCSTTPSERFSVGQVALDDNGRVLLFGGAESDGAGDVAFLGDTWTWYAGAWSQPTLNGGSPPPAPSARSGGGMARVYCGNAWRLVLFGGGNTSGLNSETWFWTYSFSATSGTWSSAETTCTIGSGPSARQTFTLEYSPGDGNVMLFGGLSGTQEALGGTWEFQA